MPSKKMTPPAGKGASGIINKNQHSGKGGYESAPERMTVTGGMKQGQKGGKVKKSGC